MRIRIFLATIFLLAAGLGAASAQQRVEFERKKFDRSRFERPGQPAPAAAPAAPAEPAFPAAPTPMATEKPAAAEGEFATPAAPPPDAAPGASAAPRAAGEPAPGEAPLWDAIPSKWFENAKDYDELVELQKTTRACLLIYFKNPSVPNEKGLCSWFEKTTMPDIAWRKAMKYYLKLEVTLPGNSAARELAEKYRVGKTPTLLVVKPSGGLPMRVNLFEYPPNSRPKPIEVPLVLESLKARSTPPYMTLF